MDGGSGRAQPTTAELPTHEVGGWLIEHQRLHRQGGSAMETYQGLIADEIVIPQSAWESADPKAAIAAAVRFAEVMENQALMLPGEFAQEASWCFYVNDYLAQVRAGGHGLYFVDRGGDELALRCCAFGLKSMLADPHLDLFNLFVRVQTSAPKIAQRVARDAGYKNISAALRDLDKRFAEIEAKEPLAPRQKTWLQSLRKLRVTPDAEYQDYLRRLAMANGLMNERRNEPARARSGPDASDAAQRVAASLCEAAGLRLIAVRASGATPLRAVWKQGPDRDAFALRVETDRGPRAALVFADGGLTKRTRAVLLEEGGGGQPAATVQLERAAYDEIAPAS